MTTQALAIAIILLLFLSINILLIRYILVPLFSKPILLHSDILPFLEAQNCLYISHSASKKKNTITSKKNFLETIFSSTKKYDLIAFSTKNNSYTLFNVLITKYYYPNFTFKRNAFLTNRNIQFIEETDLDILTEINELYQPKIKIVGDVCPACNSKTKPNSNQCSQHVF